MSEQTEQLAEQMVGNKDEIIAKTVKDICKGNPAFLSYRVVQGGSEIFSLDRVEILQFWPPKVSTETKNGRTVIQANQAYCRLDK